MDLCAEHENDRPIGANRVMRHVDDSEMRDDALSRAIVFIALSQLKGLEGI